MPDRTEADKFATRYDGQKVCLETGREVYVFEPEAVERMARLETENHALEQLCMRYLEQITKAELEVG